MARVWIGLGSNLGRPRVTLEAALAALDRTPDVRVGRVSGWFETRPVGGPPGQPGFLNTAAALATSLDPFEVLGRVQDVERQFGRRRQARWEPRTLDLDILLYDERTIESADLVVPHPWMTIRRFVLEPLAAIAGDVRHPTSGLTIDALWRRLQARPWYLAITGPAGSGKTTLAKALARRRDVELVLDAGTEDARIGCLSRRGAAAGDRWLVSDFVLGDRDPIGPVAPTLVAVLDAPAEELLHRLRRGGAAVDLSPSRLEELRRAFWNRYPRTGRVSAGLWLPVVRVAASDLAGRISEIEAAMDAVTG